MSLELSKKEHCLIKQALNDAILRESLSGCWLEDAEINELNELVKKIDPIRCVGEIEDENLPGLAREQI